MGSASIKAYNLGEVSKVFVAGSIFGDYRWVDIIWFTKGLQKKLDPSSQVGLKGLLSVVQIYLKEVEKVNSEGFRKFEETDLFKGKVLELHEISPDLYHNLSITYTTLAKFSIKSVFVEYKCQNCKNEVCELFHDYEVALDKSFSDRLARDMRCPTCKGRLEPDVSTPQNFFATLRNVMRAK